MGEEVKQVCLCVISDLVMWLIGILCEYWWINLTYLCIGTRASSGRSESRGEERRRKERGGKERRAKATFSICVVCGFALCWLCQENWEVHYEDERYIIWIMHLVNTGWIFVFLDN